MYLVEHLLYVCSFDTVYICGYFYNIILQMTQIYDFCIFILQIFHIFMVASYPQGLRNLYPSKFSAYTDVASVVRHSVFAKFTVIYNC